MSDRIRISDALAGVADALQRRGGRLRKFHREAAGAEIAPELLAEQQLDIGLVVDDENEQAHVPRLLICRATRPRAAERS